MQRPLLLLLSFLLLSVSLYTQSYEITEEELTRLETTIERQNLSISKQQVLLTNSLQKIEHLQSLTTLSEKIIVKQETLLKESEKEDLLQKVSNFFLGMLTGVCAVTIAYLVNM